MIDQSPPRTDAGFTLRFWLMVAGVTVVAALFLLPGIFTIKERVYRIDRETMAIRAALEGYKAKFGTYPAGDSAAICRALTGDNPNRTPFITLHRSSIAADGSFLDPWGTPYKIYYSGEWPLVRSAGQNKEFDSSTANKPSDDYFGG